MAAAAWPPAVSGKPVDFLTVTEVAEVFGVDRATVRRWIKEERLPAVRTPGGHWRVPQRAVERQLDQGWEPAEASEPRPIAPVVARDLKPQTRGHVR